VTGVHDSGNGFDESIPAAGFDREMFSAERREGVEARAAIVVGEAPCTLDPAALLEALQGRVEGAMIHEKGVPRSRLDGDDDAVAMV